MPNFVTRKGVSRVDAQVFYNLQKPIKLGTILRTVDYLPT